MKEPTAQRSLGQPPSCYLPSPFQDVDTRKESNNAINFELNMLQHLKSSSICLLCPASKETETKLWGMAMVWEFPQLRVYVFSLLLLLKLAKGVLTFSHGNHKGV